MATLGCGAANLMFIREFRPSTDNLGLERDDDAVSCIADEGDIPDLNSAGCETTTPGVDETLPVRCIPLLTKELQEREEEEEGGGGRLLLLLCTVVAFNPCRLGSWGFCDI